MPPIGGTVYDYVGEGSKSVGDGTSQECIVEPTVILRETNVSPDQVRLEHEYRVLQLQMQDREAERQTQIQLQRLELQKEKFELKKYRVDQDKQRLVGPPSCSSEKLKLLPRFEEIYVS